MVCMNECVCVMCVRVCARASLCGPSHYGTVLIFCKNIFTSSIPVTIIMTIIFHTLTPIEIATKFFS